MADDDKHPTAFNPFGNRVRSPEFKEYYANGLLTRVGPFDVTLVFTQNTEISPGVPAQAEQATVTMSPMQCKSMVNSLIETMTAYENTFGKINLPAELMAPAFKANQLSDIMSAATMQNREANEAGVKKLLEFFASKTSTEAAVAKKTEPIAEGARARQEKKPRR